MRIPWKRFHFQCDGAGSPPPVSTHRLQRLEAAVEEEVPDDFAVLEGRNVPYEEVRQNSQRGGEDNPAERRRKGWKQWTVLTQPIGDPNNAVHSNVFCFGLVFKTGDVPTQRASGDQLSDATITGSSI